MLFVCTANISRSPYAERRAQQLSKGPRASQFSSAGVPGAPWQAMDPAMALELNDRGGSSIGHVSRALSRDILEGVDVVITVEFAHRMRILERWPEHALKVFGLKQLAKAGGQVPAGIHGLAGLDAALRVAPPDNLSFDLADPYKRGAKAAAACANEIDRCLELILPLLGGYK